MSQANIVMGPEAKVQFNGVTMDVVDSSVRIEIKDHESNDSADATYDHSKQGRRRLVFSITANCMSDVPQTVSGTHPTIAIFPWGLTFPAYKYVSTTSRITSFQSQHPAKSGDPSTVSFEGHSTGSFTEP